MLLVIDWCSRLVSAIFGGLYCLRWPETSVVVVWFLLCVGLGGNCVVVICHSLARSGCHRQLSDGFQRRSNLFGYRCSLSLFGIRPISNQDKAIRILVWAGSNQIRFIYRPVQHDSTRFRLFWIQFTLVQVSFCLFLSVLTWFELFSVATSIFQPVFVHFMHFLGCFASVCGCFTWVLAYFYIVFGRLL